jgi:DNA-binding transcriptional MocR family regulator
MRSLYKARRTALVNSLHTEFGDLLQIHGSEAGMHLTVTLPTSFKGGVSNGARSGLSVSPRGGVSDIAIATRAAQDKLWLWPLSPCYSNGTPRQGFLLGFSNIPEDQMSAAVRRLRQALLL